MSSCMWPLMDIVGDEEIVKSITDEVMDEIKDEVDWEIKRAIDEVVSDLSKGVQR